VGKNVKTEWFEKFYGEKNSGSFNVILSMLNGGGNYAASIIHKDSSESVYAVIGCSKNDSLGNPVYNPYLIETVIHEFNHIYCNPLIYEYEKSFYPQAELFYGLVKEKMRNQAYGKSVIYLCEILVRACTLKYLSDNFGWNTAYTIRQEESRGFIWFENLYNAIDKYANTRETYHTLRSFMPEIIKLQNQLNPKKLSKQYVKNQPAIIGTNIKNGAQNIDSNLTQIIVYFNKPMNTDAYGSSYGKRSADLMPEIISTEWDKDTKKELILNVKLKPDTEYSISFPAQFLYSENGYYNPKETYYLDFKTK
jgi:hypothetical protein